LRAECAARYRRSDTWIGAKTIGAYDSVICAIDGIRLCFSPGGTLLTAGRGAWRLRLVSDPAQEAEGALAEGLAPE